MKLAALFSFLFVLIFFGLFSWPQLFFSCNSSAGSQFAFRVLLLSQSRLRFDHSRKGGKFKFIYCTWQFHGFELFSLFLFDETRSVLYRRKYFQFQNHIPFLLYRTFFWGIQFFPRSIGLEMGIRQSLNSKTKISGEGVFK